MAPHAASRLPVRRPTREVGVPAVICAGFVEAGLGALGAMHKSVLIGVVDVPAGLTADLLRTALACVARQEPPVGARYRRGPLRGCSIVDPDPEWVIEEHDDLDEDAAATVEARWVAMPLDPSDALPVSLALLHLPDHDRLLVRVSHLLADAGGVKNLLYRLARCTRRLREDPAWRPDVGRATPRSYWKVLRALRLSRLPAMVVSMLREVWAAVPRRTLDVPMSGVPETTQRALDLTLEPERVRRLHDRWNGLGYTVNDLLLAVFGVTLDQLYGAEQGPGLRVAMMVTADLRQHVPTDEDVTNFSAVRFLDLGYTPLPEVQTYLEQVSGRTTRWKRSLAGVGGAVMWLGVMPWLPDPLIGLQLRALAAFGASMRSCKVVLTNMGVLDERRLDFGDGPCLAARFVPPVGRAPILITGASGCAGALTFTVTYEDPALPEAEVRRLLERMDALLDELA